MNIVTKAAAVVESADSESASGAFEVILSAATLDRDGEIIDSRAFDPLPDHIAFDIDHGMTVTTTVGSGKPSYDEDGTLRVKGTYASTALAQEVRTLVSEGHIRTTSVTFMAAEREQKDGIPHVVKAELLNGTFTPIPSNREAVVLSSKALAAVTEKVGARNSTKDAERIQSAHDLLLDLGAACGDAAEQESAAKAVRAAVTKAVAGSYEQRERSVYEAISATYNDNDSDVWAYPVATFDDSVVFRVTGGDNAGTWRAPYSVGEDDVATLGTPEKVTVTEVITEASDATPSADSEDADSAATAAESAAEKSADEGSESVRRLADAKSTYGHLFAD